MRRTLSAFLGAVAIMLVGTASAGEPETIGAVRTLPGQPGPHWFWLSDVILHRTALFDGDSGELLGQISSGTAGVGFVINPLFSPDHSEIYLAETYYARGVRGDRTDVVTVYDATNLGVLGEVEIPPHRAEYFPGNASSALTDDGRFMAVFNLTPVTSVSIVAVRERRFVTEVSTPGCSLVYGAGSRRFLMLCANGAALSITLDDEGHETEVKRTEAFFDPQKDPVTEKAVRRGNEWQFVSFEGVVHPVDVGGAEPVFGESWPLLDDTDRKASWRIGGAQHLAVHAASNRLYALMHQGKPDTHKDPGTEIWVYDLATRKRVQRIPVLSPLLSFIRQQAPLGRVTNWILARALPNLGVDRILVTQDDHPVLIASASIPPTVTVHDAMSGAVLREVTEVGLGGTLLFAP